MTVKELVAAGGPGIRLERKAMPSSQRGTWRSGRPHHPHPPDELRLHWSWCDWCVRCVKDGAFRLCLAGLQIQITDAGTSHVEMWTHLGSKLPRIPCAHSSAAGTPWKLQGEATTLHPPHHCGGLPKKRSALLKGPLLNNESVAHVLRAPASCSPAHLAAALRPLSVSSIMARLSSARFCAAVL